MSKIVVGNWKMNPGSLKEARVIFDNILKQIKGVKGTQVVICPPFPFLSIGNNLKLKNVSLGAQNSFSEGSGSYTGEVSLKMLLSMGVKYVILGHSERRLLGDTDKIINKKILATLKSKITPILCVGELKRDDSGFYLAFIKRQLTECLSSISKNQIKNIIIAYEPIWAISDNAIHEATKDEFIEIQIFIKKVISDLYDIKTANAIRIIYGGSVGPSNVEEFLEGGVDGLLVGHNSLIPKKFGEIVKSTK